jgi:hypothetical protein
MGECVYVRMRMCVCVYVCVSYMRVYVCKCVSYRVTVSMCVYVCVCMGECVYVRMRVYVCMCVCVSLICCLYILGVHFVRFWDEARCLQEGAVNHDVEDTAVEV